MLTIGIILIIVSILLVIYSGYVLQHARQINQDIDKQNQELEKENEELKKIKKDLQYNIYTQQEKSKELSQHLIDQTELIEKRYTSMEKAQREMSQRAFENYCEVLEKNYQEKEEEYDICTDAMKTAYSTLQIQLMRDLDDVKTELDKMRRTRAAAIQAQLKEKEIKEQLAFYCLTISQTNIDDIKVLERIKPQLHEPRILSMLIWKTYYQKPMTTLCNNILGSDTVCGIYKITDQTNGMCYIGQSVDCSKRWKDHAKCGLGIDTPAGNKLYKAMQEVGLYNFSFELLEACPRSQLDEKEKYYINLYQANQYGYNILKGIN